MINSDLWFILAYFFQASQKELFWRIFFKHQLVDHLQSCDKPWGQCINYVKVYDTLSEMDVTTARQTYFHHLNDRKNQQLSVYTVYNDNLFFYLGNIFVSSIFLLC